MKTIDPKLLLSWDPVGLHPDLLAAATREKPVEVGDATQALLRGIAAAYTPGQAFAELVEAGEFKAAQSLIDSAQTARAGETQERAKMQAQLDEAAARASNQLEVRHFELATRARCVGLVPQAPDWLSLVGSRLAAAQALLDNWEREVLAAEEGRREALLARLDELLAASPGEAFGRGTWEETVRRHIERRQFAAAERILDAGEMTGDISDPAEVPRRLLWPFGDGALAGVARLLRGGDPEFKAAWGPAPGDEAALELLRSLEAYASGWGELTRDVVEGFVAALDTFLGARQAASEVAVWDGGFVARLRSLYEPCVPGFAFYGERGVPLWLPREPAAAFPEQLAEQTLVAFHPDREPAGSELALCFTSTLLFRLIGDPNRRVNFIRRLARQIRLADTMPLANFNPATLPPLDEGGAGRYAAWFFDYHGIKTDSDTVLELIVYYCASSRHLLCELLGEIGGRMQDRDETVKSSHVHAAWNSGRFRESAIAHTLGPVAHDHWLLAVLAAVLYAAGNEEEVSKDDVSTALALFGGSGDVEGALRLLIAHGLVAEGSQPERVWLPRTARTLLVAEYLGELETQIQRQLQAMSGKSGDESVA